MFIFTLFFATCFKKVIKNKQKLILVTLIVFLPTFLVSALRYDVGTDYMYTYVKYFEATKQGWLPYKNEPIFQLLNNSLVSLNLSVQWLFVITSAFFVYGLGYLLLRYSQIPLVSIIIFFLSSIFFNSLNNVRQYLSLAIIIYILFIKSKPTKVLLFIVSVLIHNSSIIFLPIYLISKVRFDKKTFIIITLFMILSSPLITFILVKVLAVTKYSYFLYEQTGYSFLLIAINAILLFYTLLYYNPRNKLYVSLSNIQVFTSIFCFCSLFFQNEEFWMRFTRILSITQPFLIPYIVLSDSKRSGRCLNLVIIMSAFFIYTFYTVYLMGGLEVYPYKSILFDNGGINFIWQI